MKIVYAALGSLVLPFALTGFGSDQPSPAAEGNPSQPGQGSSQSSQGMGPPGASGEVAAVTGRTMQVQNPVEGEVAVTWTAKTAF